MVTVEMIIGRGWSIWVNGQKPHRGPDGWEVGENGKVSYAGKPLQFENCVISRIALRDELGREINWDSDFYDSDNPPVKMTTYGEDERSSGDLDIKFFVSGNDNGETRITTLDDVTKWLNETEVYIRARG